VHADIAISSAASRSAFAMNAREGGPLNPQATIGKRLLAPLPVERTPGNNDAMVVLAVILLVLVAVLVVAIVVSNPQSYELSIFGAIIPANAAGIFITGAVTMAVTLLAVLLLRTGIRRARARRNKLKALEASDETATSGSTAAESSTTTTTTKTSSTTVTSRALEPETSKEKSASDLERESSTTPAERQAMLEEADELTREEPQK
jgi:flagellar biosynthesis/type III secretory pathway M-ring protein FliF/YscJ